MLQCAANFSDGHGGKQCDTCGVEDNENHRINMCPKWKSTEQSNEDEVNYEQVFSENEEESMKVIKRIIHMWDLGNGRNCMRMDNQS